jgi:hypothetical protein
MMLSDRSIILSLKKVMCVDLIYMILITQRIKETRLRTFHHSSSSKVSLTVYLIKYSVAY